MKSWIGKTLIAIVVVVILAAIALPNFIKAKNKGNLSNMITSGRNSARSSPNSPHAPGVTTPAYQPPSGALAPPQPGWGPPPTRPYDTTFYRDYGDNPFVSTEDETTSTFGMDVDTASYVIARRYLRDGYLPEPESVRTEEFVNYFHQEYSQPGDGNLFSITVEGAESHFGQPNLRLLRIGVKAVEASMWNRPTANMIFVVDVSGSMNREDRLEQVKISLRMLAQNLKQGDRIGLVVYGTSGRIISDLTANHGAILNAINRLTPGGSTNAAEGLRLAYEMARRNFELAKINRIILCSDGVANVGLTNADAILQQVRADAVGGITLSTIGFGMGNYNDVLMENLANHGDGMYFYLDSQAEADRIFGDSAASLLLVLASDAKVQVIFNEDTVDRFRLLGYENRLLDAQDFRDDTVDAGEVGSGQAVTALYEVRIRDEFQKNPTQKIATVRIRYENLTNGEIEEFSEYINAADLAGSFNRASRNFRFTACVAEFAEILRKSYWAEDSSLEDVLETASQCAVGQEEEEFVALVQTAIRLNG